jgi:alpha-galactosidase
MNPKSIFAAFSLTRAVGPRNDRDNDSMCFMRYSFLKLAALATCSIISCASFAAEPASQPGSGAKKPAFWDWQQTPAMGWNSWDCFGAGVNEEQTMANAGYMAKNLKAHGYNLVTIDIQWYEPLAHTDAYRRGAILEMDANGRLLPATNRFPSTKDTRSFKPIADKLHAMGFKFGLHLMRGIPRQAVDSNNVPIFGADGVYAADIADKRNVCRWNFDMYGVDMSKPGAQAYYDSVFALFASWDLDFVKVDDLSSPYHTAEIEAIRKAIDKAGRPIVFSTSPGATPVAQGEHVEMSANQWRISDDFWDQWNLLEPQFARLRDWTPYRGPGHFPDADMLPVGRLQMWQNEDAGRPTRFTRDELYTLMNLWCIARSPLIIGANLPDNDDFTLQLLTNDEVLKINQHSTNNHELMHDGSQYAWVADAENSSNKYVALFNAPPGPGRRGRGTNPVPDPATPPGPLTVSVPVSKLELDSSLKVTNIRDLWAHKGLGASDTISVELQPHQSAVFEVQVGRK